MDYLTSEVPCTYLNDETRTMVALFDSVVRTGKYEFKSRKLSRDEKYRLIEEKGFISINSAPSAPCCETCQKCVPLRINGDKVAFTKSQKENFVKNSNRFETQLTNSRATGREHHRLYEDYLARRHPESGMRDKSYEQFLNGCLAKNSILNIYDKGDSHRLVAFAQIDIHEQAATFDYLAYDAALSNSKHSLGTFAWLALIHRCREHDIKHMYVGPWVEGSRKMGYKSRFPGLETIVDSEWVDFDPEIHKTGPDYNKVVLDILGLTPSNS